ncbi:MAG: HAD family hydrolase [Ruminococcaceae bacterium]|nr:HAD family hydrolase [Oscillospiraceae bacterium]
MIKLCIFDLDGTVLDTIGTIAYYANNALEKNGVAPIEVEEYKYLVGTGIANLVRKMLEFRNCYSEELYGRVYHDYDTAYNADVAYKTTVFDGLREVLDRIKSQGIRMAIVSNKPDFAAQTVITRLYGDGYFDFVTGQKPGAPLKPDPTVVLSVMKDMNVCPEDCIYVGDTSTDMKTGKNARLFTVGVLWGFRGREELLENGADRLAEKPQDLLDCIATLST